MRRGHLNGVVSEDGHAGDGAPEKELAHGELPALLGLEVLDTEERRRADHSDGNDCLDRGHEGAFRWGRWSLAGKVTGQVNCVKAHQGQLGGRGCFHRGDVDELERQGDG